MQSCVPASCQHITPLIAVLPQPCLTHSLLRLLRCLCPQLQDSGPVCVSLVSLTQRHMKLPHRVLGQSSPSCRHRHSLGAKADQSPN